MPLPAGKSGSSILEVLGLNSEFSETSKLVAAAGLEAKYQEASQAATFFAPTNAAWKSFAKHTGVTTQDLALNTQPIGAVRPTPGIGQLLFSQITRSKPQ